MTISCILPLRHPPWLARVKGMADLSTTSAMPDHLGAFGRYLAEERMLQPRTRARYEAVASAFLVFAEERGVKCCERFEEIDFLRDFLRLGANKGGKPSRGGWNLRLSALRAFLDYLVRVGALQENKAMNINPIPTKAIERVPLTLDEMIRLVDVAEEDVRSFARIRNTAILKLVFHSAIRVSELVGLDANQVDLENYLLHEVRTKGDKHLAVAINDVVAEALEAYLKERAKLGLPSTESALFVSDRRQRLSVRAVQDLVPRLAAAAGIARTVTPHILRHSSVTQLVDLGVNLRTVQEICGHASIRTTQRYAHVAAKDRKAAVDRLGSAWKTATGKKKRKELTPEEN